MLQILCIATCLLIALGSCAIREAPAERALPKRDIQSILDTGRVVPTWRNGQFAGIRVAKIRPGGFLEQIGLKSGDVVVQVDDEVLDEVEEVSLFLNTPSAAPRFLLRVQRDQRPDAPTVELIWPPAA